ncbi:MAG: indole-3-glycerol-phosphate synthase TrpC [Euryarchaeota archaeon]|nr:indole-3-glycerol-phosphate synthase TrpC [Euryarchaeota archaeon]
MNAGAALYVAEFVAEIEDGVDVAQRTIRGGRGLAKLKEFSAASVEIEKERQMECRSSDLSDRKILPDVLLGRCGEICADLLSRVSLEEGGEQVLANLHPEILTNPSALSVLALSRALGAIRSEPASSVTTHHCRRELSEAILSSPGVSIIGEFKPTSPSATPLLLPPSPEEVAEVYPGEGVAAVSVLVESQYFGGGPELFSFFRSILPIPMLYKDFVLSVKQVEEAHRLGADAVLLIAKLLAEEAMEELVRASILRGMEPLVEIHDLEDLEKFRSSSCSDEVKLIGINCRDLRTLRTDPEKGLKMRDAVGSGPIVIMESGIRSAEQIRQLGGFDAVLIGSMFMQADDLRATVREAVAVGRSVTR